MYMKNVLIVSATLNNNYNLGKELKTFLMDLDTDCSLISLENYTLPVYTDKVFDEKKQIHRQLIEDITDQFVKANGLIICGPEYNGSTPPILNNAIAWISCSTDYWRDAFSNKIALVATSSGGPGIKFVSAIKMQLEHLGCIVMPRPISSNNSSPMSKDSIKKILNQFVKHL